MSGYLFTRLGQSLLVLTIMSFVIYSLIGLMPGDPIDMMISADPFMTPEDAAYLRSLYGLDLPVYERYWNWLVAAAGGDFGYSRLYNQPVALVLGPALGNSIQLLLSALTISVLVAVPAGVLAAYRQRSVLDYSVNLFAFAGISIPQFWLGLMLIMLFAVILGWLPAGGIAPEGSGLDEQLRYLLLPAATLTMTSIGSHARYVRSAMLEVLRQDYIRTARAKGAGAPRVMWRHALRNALIPFVTVLALDFGFLFSGALIVETIFGWPGMGRLIFDAIMGNDYNLALVSLMLATALVLTGNVLADLTYAWLDPRIKLGRRVAR
jgi:peptide/nickel transport system permease protein